MRGLSSFTRENPVATSEYVALALAGWAVMVVAGVYIWTGAVIWLEKETNATVFTSSKEPHDSGTLSEDQSD